MPASDLVKAVWKNDLAMIRSLAANGADVNRRDRDERTPLMQAITSFKPSVQTVELLLELGADVNAVEKSHGYSALSFAAQDQKP